MRGGLTHRVARLVEMDTPEPILVTSKFSADELNCQTVEIYFKAPEKPEPGIGCFIANSAGDGLLDIRVSISVLDEGTGVFTQLLYSLPQAFSDAICPHTNRQVAQFQIREMFF